MGSLRKLTEYASLGEALRDLQRLGHIPLKQGFDVECYKCGGCWCFDTLPDGGVVTGKRPEECG